MLRCFSSPFTRACKTCKHWDVDEGIYVCASDVDLGVARCSACGAALDPREGSCPEGHGDKPVYGLRVQCDLWEAADA
jgi:hypothetical protein